MKFTQVLYLSLFLFCSLSIGASSAELTRAINAIEQGSTSSTDIEQISNAANNGNLKAIAYSDISDDEKEQRTDSSVINFDKALEMYLAASLQWMPSAQESLALALSRMTLKPREIKITNASKYVPESLRTKYAPIDSTLASYYWYLMYKVREKRGDSMFDEHLLKAESDLYSSGLTTEEINKAKAMARETYNNFMGKSYIK